MEPRSDAPFQPINMDRNQRVVINTLAQDWTPSPASGVWRIQLEREAAEAGQVTSIVRYEPDTHFSSHYHPNGEEIFVVNGIFEDEFGTYPAGTYLRNPARTRHAPASQSGCMLYVKLNMFPEGDQETLRIDTHNARWQPGHYTGQSVLPLHGFGSDKTIMIQWQAGASLPKQIYESGLELFILAGSFQDEWGEYRQGYWLRTPPGSYHHPATQEGCLLLVKTGHFPHEQT
ncbi:cupin domain-containing protein [Photobacterium sp. CCB-ST2H9]|uniref:cupin domain-containing protein n=1 Tax=Photobacterium sp. CCB-ST2H9 TaxID=2912855 RepID=UPI002004385A|nr:cupin domain-containing protein [Photobacterium sp. CCB-ST2H9]UTM60270.1 cupin domain-containing protein [Photobacterium sp. CCB-ST2H9]